MSRASQDDFYVGHTPGSAPGHRRFAVAAALAVALLLVVIGVVLAALQAPFDPGIFEYGETRSLRGTLLRGPPPRLLLETPLERPETVTAGPPYAEMLLVGLGKSGADGLDGLDGAPVEARGTLIARGSTAMLELAARPELLAAEEPTPRPTPTPSGRTEVLVGEIVDSKCFLGVMKPGRGKVHRACATLCLEGGVPPAFVVRTPDEDRGDRAPADTWVALLLGPDGGPIEASLAKWIGEPVRLEGRLLNRDDETARLLVDPASIRRLR